MSKFFLSFARLLGALMLVAATLLNAAPAAASSTNAPQGVKVDEIAMPAPWPAIQVISLDVFPSGLQDVVVRDNIRIGKSREGFLVIERLGAGKALKLQTQCRADMKGGAQCAALGLVGDEEFVRHIPVEVPEGSVYMFFMGRFCAPYQFDLDEPFGYGVGVDADASKCGTTKEHKFTVSANPTCEGWAAEATSDESASFDYQPAQFRGWQDGETAVQVSVTATFADGQTMTKSVTIDRPTNCGGGKDRSRMWPTGMPILGCQALPQYSNEAVWMKEYGLIHINTENRPAGEHWDVVQSSFSADGVNWTTAPVPTRVIGIESRSIPMEQVVWVNFLASQQNADVATFGDTHLLRDSLPGVDPLNYEKVRALGFHIQHPDQPERLLGPARKGTAADAEYKWAYEVNVARCATKTTTPPVKVRACFQTLDGGLGRFEFEGEVPVGYTPLADEACEVHPPTLPKTAGQIDEVQAEALIASANQDALWATLAIFVLFFGVLLVSRRRFASATAR